MLSIGKLIDLCNWSLGKQSEAKEMFFSWKGSLDIKEVLNFLNCWTRHFTKEDLLEILQRFGIFLVAWISHTTPHGASKKTYTFHSLIACKISWMFSEHLILILVPTSITLFARRNIKQGNFTHSWRNNWTFNNCSADYRTFVFLQLCHLYGDTLEIPQPTNINVE